MNKVIISTVALILATSAYATDLPSKKKAPAAPAPVASAPAEDEPPFDADDAPASTAPVQAKPSSQRAEDILAMIRNRQK